MTVPVPQAQRSVASSFGHDSRDSTHHLQAALDSDAAIVVIDNVPGGWTTGPLWVNRSDVTIVIEPGVVIRAQGSGEFASLLTILDQQRIRIIGYGARIEMTKNRFRGRTAQRMAIALRSVTDVTIEGITIVNSIGDSIYLGIGRERAHSTRVTVRDVSCINSSRHGIGVTTVAGLLIDGCSFLESNGSEPEVGLTFHPNQSGEQLTGITVQNCTFHGNLGHQILIDDTKLSDTSQPLDITIDQCNFSTMTRNLTRPMIQVRQRYRGVIDIQGSLIRYSNRARVLSVGSSDEADTSWDYELAKDAEPIVLLTKGDYAHGALQLHNIVVMPYDAATDDQALVTVKPLTPTITRGRTGGFVFRRERGSFHQPLAIPFTTTGSATERYDHGGLPGFVVLPAGETEVILPVRALPRRRPSDPGTVTLGIHVDEGPVRLTGHHAQLTIQDEGDAR